MIIKPSYFDKKSQGEQLHLKSDAINRIKPFESLTLDENASNVCTSLQVA
jgi:hypothetical protein